METFLLLHNSQQLLFTANNGEAPEIGRSVFFQCPDLLHPPPFSSSRIKLLPLNSRKFPFLRILDCC